MDYIREAHGPEGRIPHLRAQHRAPHSAPGGASAGTRALRRPHRTSLRNPHAASRTRLCLKVSGRPPPLRSGSRRGTRGCRYPGSEPRVVLRLLPGFAVRFRPGRDGGRARSRRGKPAPFEAPINSFAQEDLQGRPARKQFVNNRISLPPS